MDFLSAGTKKMAVFFLERGGRLLRMFDCILKPDETGYNENLHTGDYFSFPSHCIDATRCIYIFPCF